MRFDTVTNLYILPENNPITEHSLGFSLAHIYTRTFCCLVICDKHIGGATHRVEKFPHRHNHILVLD